MGLREQIDDLIELGTIKLLDWNDAMTDLQLDKIQAISAVQRWSIRIRREFRVVKNPCLKHHPRSPSITSDGLYLQEEWYAPRNANSQECERHIKAIWMPTSASSYKKWKKKNLTLYKLLKGTSSGQTNS
ncbi:hypothetical protein M9H77_03194 [Catharanthus roseus]|uniref:Uncharacterized protein n=1 Tax=Catharanthus roseus TaxID=4058 RepID=A0ACC0CAL6_CATRO|nr:hypothetical protein M9H77_03194 [Catharanthus roseus]